MASYQDIEQRLRRVEELLQFIGTIFKINGVIATGVVDQNGQPIQKVESHSLMEWFLMSRESIAQAKSDLLLVEPTSTPDPLPETVNNAN